MVAAPYTASLVFANAQNPNERISYYCTASDVTTEKYVFPDGQTTVTLPPGKSWVFADLILSAAGTDTSQAQVFVNGNVIGVTIANAANVYNVLQRQVPSLALAFKGGSSVQFTQLT